MNQKTRVILIHVICSAAFLSVPLVSGPEDQTIAQKLRSEITHSELLGYALSLLFFYFNYLYFIPRLYFQRKYTLYFLVLFSAFFITASASYFIKKDGPPPISNSLGINTEIRPLPPDHGYWGDATRTIPRFSLAFFLSLLLKINTRWRQSEAEKTQAELSFMKAQINPHFLFNTLNGIYSLALEKSDVTANAIAQLSGMMRYITSEAGTDFVPLEKELNYIQNYIELQKIRFGNTVLLDFQIHNQSKNQKIAPLILITFIENAFKYGVNPEEESHILIQITIENAKLEMQVINKKVEIQPAKATATSLGIINTQKRLEYLYPGQYDLSIKEKDHHYHVFLNLNL